MDDRGKFIYISEEEMASVAKYINKKGRVTIAGARTAAAVNSHNHAMFAASCCFFAPSLLVDSSFIRSFLADLAAGIAREKLIVMKDETETETKTATAS